MVPYLKKYGVAGYDANLPGRDFGTGVEAAADFGADVIAISFRNVDTTQERDPFCYYPYFLEALRELRTRLPKAVIVVGGAAFSLYADEIMAAAPEVDVGIVGEGEGVIDAVIGAAGRYDAIPGVIYRRDGRTVKTSPAPLFNYAAALPPDRRVFNVRDYLFEPFAVGVQTQRGCPWRCAYCTYPALEGTRLRARPVAAVVDEIEALAREGVTTFTFVDAVWGATPARAKDICREIIRRQLNVKWKAYFSERHLDEELVDLALAAGAAEFTFSPDAADDKVLAQLGKDITAADLCRTLGIFKDRSSAVVSYSFFINPPGQTLGSFWKIVKFYLTAKRRLGKRFLGASFGNIRLERGAPLYELARAAGKLHRGMDLLPKTRRDLTRLFYHHNWYFKLLSRIYIILWRAKKWALRFLKVSR